MNESRECQQQLTFQLLSWLVGLITGIESDKPIIFLPWKVSIWFLLNYIHFPLFMASQTASSEGSGSTLKCTGGGGDLGIPTPWKLTSPSLMRAAKKSGETGEWAERRKCSPVLKSIPPSPSDDEDCSSSDLSATMMSNNHGCAHHQLTNLMVVLHPLFQGPWTLQRSRLPFLLCKRNLHFRLLSAIQIDGSNAVNTIGPQRLSFTFTKLHPGNVSTTLFN